MVTKEEYEAQQERFAKRQAEADTKRATMIRQASVSAEYLTGNEHWDKAMTYIQAKLEDAEKSIANTKDQIMLAVDDSAIRACQIRHGYAKGLLDAYTEIRNLPKQVTEESKIIRPM
jgi:F0F1-type ATP synthase membrane subunit b/b'